MGREDVRERLWRAAVGVGRDYPVERLSDSLMVFAPHPDDETLGCGGLILRKREAGAPVTVVFMTDGSRSHAAYMRAEDLRAVREQEGREACRRLGVADESVVFCGYPDAALQDVREAAIARVASLLRADRPGEVAIPYRHDVTRDHVATHHIVRAAIRASGLSVRILEYPVWFWSAWPWTRLTYGGRRQALHDAVRSVLAAGRLVVQLRCQLPIDRHTAAKRSALDGHRSQLVKLRPETPWPTLQEVAGGDFLSCFFRSHERYMTYRYGPGS